MIVMYIAGSRSGQVVRRHRQFQVNIFTLNNPQKQILLPEILSFDWLPSFPCNEASNVWNMPADPVDGASIFRCRQPVIDFGVIRSDRQGYHLTQKFTLTCGTMSPGCFGLSRILPSRMQMLYSTVSSHAAKMTSRESIIYAVR